MSVSDSIPLSSRTLGQKRAWQLNAYLFSLRTHQPANAARSTARPAELCSNAGTVDFLRTMRSGTRLHLMKRSTRRKLKGQFPNRLPILLRSFLFSFSQKLQLAFQTRGDAEGHLSITIHDVWNKLSTSFSCCNPNDSLTQTFQILSRGTCERWRQPRSLLPLESAS
jgi:hypothetical protein